MKKTHIIEVENKNYNIEEIDELIKKALVAENIKMKDIELINSYIKPSEDQVYYVVTLRDGRIIREKLF